MPLFAITIAILKAPLGVTWQQHGPLFWVHIAWSDCRKIVNKVDAILMMGLKLRYYTNKIFNTEPDIVVLPLSQLELSTLMQNSTLFQTLMINFPGQIDNHLPADRLLQTLKTLEIDYPKHAFPANQPIPMAPCVFMDANKSLFGIVSKS